MGHRTNRIARRSRLGGDPSERGDDVAAPPHRRTSSSEAAGSRVSGLASTVGDMHRIWRRFHAVDATVGGLNGFESSSMRGLLGRCLPAQRLTGPAVEVGRDVVEVVSGKHRQIGALGKVLTQLAHWCSRWFRAATASADHRSRCPDRWPRRSRCGWPSPCPDPTSRSYAGSPATGPSWPRSPPAPPGRCARRGRCSSRVNRVARSTRVPIAEPEAVLPRIRSPSQCPGTARSSTSGGRSLILTMSRRRPRP